MDEKDVERILAFITERISKGDSPELYKDLLDKALGTELEERDPSIEEAWQNYYGRDD